VIPVFWAMPVVIVFKNCGGKPIKSAEKQFL